MTEVSELKIQREDLINILNEYYSKKLGRKVTVREAHSIGHVGLYEDEDVEVKFSFDEVISIGAFKGVKTTFLEYEDVKNTLGSYLDEQGYLIDSMTYDAGICSVGYREDRESYFKGVNLKIREKGSIMRLERRGK